MGNNNLPQAYQTPFEDIKKQALEHYEDISAKAFHWNSLVPKAIMAYDPDHESKLKPFLEWLTYQIEIWKDQADRDKEKGFFESSDYAYNRHAAMKEVKKKFIELTLTPPPSKQ